MPKYSFIVAMYNIENYINRCIDSLLVQTYKDFEIIVVNDGSTDGSLEKIKKYENQIRIINKDNGGLSSARNRGIDESLGEYLIFIDGDDYVEKDYLEKFNDSNDNKADIYLAGFTRDVNNKNIVEAHEEIKNIEDYKTIYLKMIGPSYIDPKEKHYLMTAWAKCYKKQFLTDNNLKFKSEREYVSEDLIFHTDIYEFNPIIKYVLNTGYHYVDNDYHSLTKTFKKDKACKEIKLRKYLLEKAYINIFQPVDLYRIHYNFLSRYDEILRNYIYQKEEKKFIKNLLNEEMLQESLCFCKKAKVPFKHKIRIFYLYKKNMCLLKIVAKIRR